MKLPRPNWFEVIFWTIVLGCTAGALVGCEQKAEPAKPTSVVPHMRIPAGTPPGSTVEFEAVIDDGERVISETASGTGAGLSTNSDEAAAKFTTTAPGVGLPGVSATGGDASSEFSIRTIKGAAGNPLLWVGIACILGAVVALYFGLRRAALFAACAGGGLICAAMLPQWAWIILASVGAIGLGVYLWAEYSGKRGTEAARATAAGISDLKRLPPAWEQDPDNPGKFKPFSIYERAKDHVAAHADPSDVRTIAVIKAKDRL